MRAALVALALFSVAASAPSAGAAYSCSGELPRVTYCTGFDRAPDCWGRNVHYDWGYDVFVSGGYTVAVGGTKWCAQDANGTKEGKSMDAGVYLPQDQRVAWRSDSLRTTPTGGEPEATCVSALQTWTSVYRFSWTFGCLAQPAHPGELLP